MFSVSCLPLLAVNRRGHGSDRTLLRWQVQVKRKKNLKNMKRRYWWAMNKWTFTTQKEKTEDKTSKTPRQKTKNEEKLK
jgi:hypothetical protein